MAQQTHLEQLAGREATARERARTPPTLDDDTLDNDDTATFPTITDEGAAATLISDDTPDEWRVGDIVDGRFVVQQSLGAGTYGPLFKALDRALSEPQIGVEHYVVLEELPPWVAERATFIERLEQLRLQPQSWSHPNIAKALGFGRDGDKYFLCEEWLEGASLRVVLEASAPNALEEHEVLGILRYVGDALSYAHAKGIVHGDLRLDNVFVTEDYEVKLTGFLPSTEPRARAVFVEDPSTGGQPHSSDDVYGLACLAYELLTRRHPYGGKTPLEALGAGLTASPPPKLSPERWQALSRGLALRRARRTATVAELLRGLGVTGDETLRPSSKNIEPAAPPLEATPPETALWPTITSAAARSSARFASSPAAAPPVSEHFAVEIPADSLDEIYPEAPARLARVRRHRKRSSPVRTVLGLVIAAGLATYTYLNHSWLRDRAADWMETATALVSQRREPTAPARTAIEPRATVPATEPRATVPPTEPSAAPRAASAAVETPVAPAVAEPAPTAPAESAPEPEPAPTTTAPAPRDLPAPTQAAPQPPTAAAVAAPPRFAFVDRALTVNESDGSARVSIRRSGSLDEEANVVWWATDGTATGDDDYAVLGARVARFAVGEDTLVLHVPLISDSMPEPRESFFVHLRSERAGGAAMQLEIVVLDDDR